MHNDCKRRGEGAIAEAVKPAAQDRRPIRQSVFSSDARSERIFASKAWARDVADGGAAP